MMMMIVMSIPLNENWRASQMGRMKEKLLCKMHNQIQFHHVDLKREKLKLIEEGFGFEGNNSILLSP
jgi:hypothetical protein